MNTALPGNSENSGLNRRSFLTLLSAAGAALPFAGIGSAPAAAAEPTAAAASDGPLSISFFSKPLDRFETAFMADTLAAAGVDGIDLTVRPGGKVEPERVEDDLPRFADAIRNHKLALPMMVTSITGTDSPFAEKVLRAASQVGIRHYRLGYLDFDYQAGIWQSLQNYKPKLRELAELNRQHRVQAGYQNHTGTRIGAAIWDLWELLRDLPAEQISVQYDIRHAVTEGAVSWVNGMRLIRPCIGSLAIKDFTWDVSGRRPRIVSVPLGEGIIDFDAYFKLVKDLGIRAPFSLHIEYPLLTRDEESVSLADKQRIITAKLKKDVDYVREQLSKHQLL